VSILWVLLELVEWSENHCAIFGGGGDVRRRGHRLSPMRGVDLAGTRVVAAYLALSTGVG